MEALCFPHLPNNSDTRQNGDEVLFSSFGAINSTCDRQTHTTERRDSDGSPLRLVPHWMREERERLTRGRGRDAIGRTTNAD